MFRSFGALLLAMQLLGALPAAAETQLSAGLETRARALFLELRCVVCQNQSIGDSDADVAKDLREIVREQISAGKSNDQIKSFLVARYGEFILLRPVFAWHTFLLWGAPVLLLLLGCVLAWRASNQISSNTSAPALSKSEEEELSKILNS